MGQKKSDIPNVESLRKKAEELVKNDSSKAKTEHSEDDVRKLVHELEVHRLELELQKEEYEIQASELVIANKELKFQIEEKAKRAAELVISNKELEFKAALLNANEELKKSEYRLKERNKELQALFGLSQLAENEESDLEILYRKVLYLLTDAWQYPEITCCRIVIDGVDYCTDNFAVTEWKQSAQVKVNDNVIGSIDVLYLKEMQKGDEGPFSKEERNLINAIAERLGRIIERKLLREKKRKDDDIIRTLSSAIGQSPVSTVITDINGNIEFVNPMFTEVTGYTFEEVKGRNHRIFKSGETSEHDYRELWDTILSGKNWHGEFHNRKKSGELYYESAIISPVKNDKDKIIHFLALKQDITERKKIDDEIKRKNEQLIELNSEKDKFFSIIAHDLRGPFNGFLGLTDIFASELSTMTLDEIQKLALLMKDSANNLFSLLENLLEWSRMQRGLMVISANQFLLKDEISVSIAPLFAASLKKSISIDYDIPDDLQVFADRNLFAGTIRNLVSNALKFSNKGGSIIVSANVTADNKVEVSVNDNGIGMNKEIMENLFSIDVKINRKGTDGETSTGLGLLICKEFVEKNGGQLSIESKEGKGSMFKFTLPCSEEMSSLKNVNVDKYDERKINKLKILIAEDDHISSKLLIRTLSTFSREILNAGTGLEAVEICRNNPDIDLILMDIKMPGIDGFEAAREIRKFNKDVVLIAQTAFAPEGYADKTIAAGFNDYVAKLFDIEIFEDIIKKHFS
jgi:PAS domain S-box-containing protein